MSHRPHTLYLHIGLHKTGTSAFQRTVAQVADKQSFVYPDFNERVEGDFSHNIVVGYMHTHRKICSEIPATNIQTEPITHEMLKLRELFFDQLRTTSVLLSAEEFSKELLDEDHSRRWQELFSYFQTVRVALVLRRYDHLWNSVASEIVKTSFHGNMLIDRSSGEYPVYDVSSLLKIIRSFGWQIDIFSYDRLTKQQALIPRLLTWCGLEPSDMPSDLLTTRVNRKFHRRKSLFCSMLDKTSMSELDKVALVKSISACTAIVDDGEDFLYSPQELDAFYTSTKQLNAAALATAGIFDIDDFFNYEALTPNLNWTPPRAPTAAEITAAREEIMEDTGIDIRDICLDHHTIYPYKQCNF
jgi:hypothetical protein